MLWLATGTGAGLSFALYQSRKENIQIEQENKNIARPKLIKGVTWGEYDGKITLKQKEKDIHCAVNDSGEAIIKLLDGKNSIEDITKKINNKEDEVLSSKIAYFVANLGMLGLLEEAFYAYIIENESNYS